MFRKSPPKTLHDLHNEAHAQSARALSLFHDIASDLQAAADKHLSVADEAYSQIESLSDLAGYSVDAAADKRRKAEAIAALVS